MHEREHRQSIQAPLFHDNTKPCAGHNCTAACHSMYRGLIRMTLSAILTARIRIDATETRTKLNAFGVVVAEPEWLNAPLSEATLAWQGPLNLDILLDTSGISSEEHTLLLDSPITSSIRPIGKELVTAEAADGIILESWRIEIDHKQMANVSEFDWRQRAIVVIRSFISSSRLLPAHRLAKSISSRHDPLRLKFKLSHKPLKDENIIGLDKSMLDEGHYEPSDVVSLPALRGPHGAIVLSVQYRRQCGFILESKTAMIERRRAEIEDEYTVIAGTSANSPGEISSSRPKPRNSLILQMDPAPFGTTPPGGISFRKPKSRRRSEDLGSSRRRSVDNSPSASNSRSSLSRQPGSLSGISSRLAEDLEATRFVKECEAHKPFSNPPFTRLLENADIQDILKEARRSRQNIDEIRERWVPKNNVEANNAQHLLTLSKSQSRTIFPLYEQDEASRTSTPLTKQANLKSLGLARSDPPSTTTTSDPSATENTSRSLVVGSAADDIFSLH